MREKDAWYIRAYWACWRFFCNLPSALRFRFKYKFHIIKTQLNPWEWHDTDKRLLYGMMDLFVDFYEQEVVDGGIVDWDGDDDHKKTYVEMLAIYNWWKNYNNRLKEIDDALDVWYESSQDFVIEKTDDADNDIIKIKKSPMDDKERVHLDKLHNKLHKLENKLIDEEEEMMIRLVKIRHCLGT
jgi:hypothetical protein